MNTKILMVEDNPDIALVMRARLEVSGFQVEKADDGEEALRKARSVHPDLILMDLMIPKINGFEACRMLKFDEATKNIPIVVLSALSEQRDREKAIASGADAFFIKPFELDLLVVKIRSLTEKK